MRGFTLCGKFDKMKFKKFHCGKMYTSHKPHFLATYVDPEFDRFDSAVIGAIAVNVPFVLLKKLSMNRELFSFKYRLQVLTTDGKIGWINAYSGATEFKEYKP